MSKLLAASDELFYKEQFMWVKVIEIIVSSMKLYTQGVIGFVLLSFVSYIANDYNINYVELIGSSVLLMGIMVIISSIRITYDIWQKDVLTSVIWVAISYIIAYISILFLFEYTIWEIYYYVNGDINYMVSIFIATGVILWLLVKLCHLLLTAYKKSLMFRFLVSIGIMNENHIVDREKLDLYINNNEGLVAYSYIKEESFDQFARIIDAHGNDLVAPPELMIIKSELTFISYIWDVDVSLFAKMK